MIKKSIKNRIAGFIAAVAMAVTVIPSSIAIPKYNQAQMISYAEENYSIPDLKLENKQVPDTESFRFVNSMGAGFNLETLLTLSIIPPLSRATQICSLNTIGSAIRKQA